MSSILPYIGPGQSVGLLGGSFDPPHAGHVHISREAFKRFGLDWLIWLVTPGNPLKASGPAPLDARMRACKALIRHPRFIISDAEQRMGTRATADTLAALQGRYPQLRFVWLMGADNLAQFHLWQDWEQIMQTVPIGVLARPGDRISATMSPAARLFRRYRLPGRCSHLLALAEPPAWCFVNVPMVDLSSTALRESGHWQVGQGPNGNSPITS